MVSIIITTFKRNADILERAIRSAQSQTYQNKEIIIVNDCPEYKELVDNVVKKFPDVKVLHHSSQCGACVSRNDGVMLANGEYIAFLDDDDEWREDKIEHQVKSAIDTNADLVYCSGISLDDNSGKSFELSFIKDCTDDRYYEKLLCENIIGGCSFPLLKKSSFLEVGGFNEALLASQDLELWIRLSRNYRLHFLNERLVIYHTGNTAISTNIDRKIQGYQTLYHLHQDEYKEHPDSAYAFFHMMIRDSIDFNRTDYLIQSLKLCKEYNFLYRIRLYIYAGSNYIYKHTIKRSKLRRST